MRSTTTIYPSGSQYQTILYREKWHANQPLVGRLSSLPNYQMTSFLVGANVVVNTVHDPGWEILFVLSKMTLNLFYLVLNHLLYTKSEFLFLGPVSRSLLKIKVTLN